MSTKKKPSPESIVREIKRRTRRKYSDEEKIQIVLEGLRGEQRITDLCRKKGIHPGIYYKWRKAFLEAGKQRLTGDTIREAGSKEVKDLKAEKIVFPRASADWFHPNLLTAVSLTMKTDP